MIRYEPIGELCLDLYPAERVSNHHHHHHHQDSRKKSQNNLPRDKSWRSGQPCQLRLFSFYSSYSSATSAYMSTILLIHTEPWAECAAIMFHRIASFLNPSFPQLRRVAWPLSGQQPPKPPLSILPARMTLLPSLARLQEHPD